MGLTAAEEIQQDVSNCFSARAGAKIMFVKKLLVSAMIAAGMLGCVAIPQPGVAESSGDVFLDSAPPPPRYEAVPPPRSGYVWSPGYWGWDGYRRTPVWVDGPWVAARARYSYSSR